VGSPQRPRRGALALATLALWLGGVAGAQPTLRPVARRSAAWQARHREILEAPGRRRARLCFLGDSITQGWRSVGGEHWDRFYAPRHALNLGVNGDCTRHVLWRLQHGELDGLPARLLVLLIGTNDAYYPDASATAIAGRVAFLVREVRRRLPRARVLLLGIFPSGSRGSARRAKLALVNRELARLHDGRAIHFLDLWPRFLRRNGSLNAGISADALHLTPEGYRIWATAMEPKLRALLGAR